MVKYYSQWYMLKVYKSDFWLDSNTIPTDRGGPLCISGGGGPLRLKIINTFIVKLHQLQLKTTIGYITCLYLGAFQSSEHGRFQACYFLGGTLGPSSIPHPPMGGQIFPKPCHLLQ